ncbi:tetratricopeptide repeat protein [Aquimarina sp. W85]|uniref:type IX secretion system periplasmic lipoprotein PorW/SprE n=1 Tax=Aquimarina rhodophyticola TaxID=3342246 RepID=UPI00367142EB
MKFKFLQIFGFVIILITGLACSRKKDKFINRVWHDVTTKNNTLYNGRIAYDQGKEEIVRSYNDNFWELLPVERLTVSEDVRLPNEVLNENFDRAEEKAVKAIQKHSMLIDGRERNPKIDEAFLLLGKARYNEQRFIPALEAFNYILYKYPTSNTINHAKVWRAKTNMRLDNNQKAIDDLKKMINEEFLDTEDYADATAMIAQAFINLKKTDSAITYINKAGVHTKNNEYKGRYYFIKGQLLNQLNYKDSANSAFTQVIDLNRRTSRAYLINAHMARARNFEYSPNTNAILLEELEKLEKNRENRPFLDRIFNQKAVYYAAIDSMQLAIENYNKSLRTNSKDTYLESLNYKALGDIEFDSKEYALAGAYYDSTLERMNVNSKKYRTLKKKRDNLDDVILYEGIAKVNDSILNVVAMSPSQKTAYYSKYTDSIKAIAVAKLEAAEVERIKSALPYESRYNPRTPKAVGGSNTEGTFYFYNPTTVGFGKTSFKRMYGNRELQDNWRISSITNPLSVQVAETVTEDVYDIDQDPLYDPQTYIDQLPTSTVAIDSIKKERNFSYYQLGIIYKEKFREYDLAIDKLNFLLEHQPEQRLIVPAKYNLYKIYQLREEDALANSIKTSIINDHGTSRYGKILQNPERALEQDKESPEAIYNQLYLRFKQQQYDAVIVQSDKMIAQLDSEEYIPKFELLKAQAIGRYRGLDAYKKALNYVALNYPQSPEGKKAQSIYQTAVPQLENKMFSQDIEDQNNHKLVYPFSNFGDNQITQLKETVQNILKELRYDKMKVSIDVYNDSQQLLVIHTKRNKLGAEGLAELLSIGKTENTTGVDLSNWNRKKKYYPAIKAAYFVIASPNYRILQIHKNLEHYNELVSNQ